VVSPLKKEKKNREYLLLTVKRVYIRISPAEEKLMFLSRNTAALFLLLLLLQSEEGKDNSSITRAVSKSTALKERFGCCCHLTEKKRTP